MTLHKLMVVFFFPPQEGYDFCCIVATALLAQHLWCMFRPVEEENVLGLRTGREEMAPVRMETMMLVLKALSYLELSRALLGASSRDTIKLTDVTKRIS